MADILRKLLVPIACSSVCIGAVTIAGLCTVYTDAAILLFFFGASLWREFIGFVKYKGKETLHGKTVIITGANSGIGKETAKDLAKRGGRIIMAARSVAKNEEARREVVEYSSNNNVVCKHLDLSSLKSVREFCKDINETEPRVDILINNAGVMMCPKALTEDGFEMQIGTNHIGHFLLTKLLLDKLKDCAPSRIVILSSVGHEQGNMNFDDLNSEKSYGKMAAYCQAKLANVLHSLELSKKLKDTGVTTYSLHPGAVDTELLRHLSGFSSYIGRFFMYPMFYYLWRTPVEGAQTTIRCAVDPALETVTGKYYVNCKEKQPSKLAQNEEDAKRLWEISEEWTKSKGL